MTETQKKHPGTVYFVCFWFGFLGSFPFPIACSGALGVDFLLFS